MQHGAVYELKVNGCLIERRSDFVGLVIDDKRVTAFALSLEYVVHSMFTN